jgi:hypothetical protein
MSKSSRQAGQNIRKLAVKRRVNAVISFASAGLAVSIPFFLVKAFEALCSESLTVAILIKFATHSLYILRYCCFELGGKGCLLIETSQSC